jgi:hypothetical protein
MRLCITIVSVAALLSTSYAQAQISDSVVRIGVLNDQSILYAAWMRLSIFQTPGVRWLSTKSCAALNMPFWRRALLPRI